MRLFIALELPEPVRDALAESARRLAEGCAAGRFVPPEQYHLTLAFLGEQPEAMAARASQVMDGCRRAPFPAAFGSFGAFPGRRGAVLWRGVEVPCDLEALQRDLARGLTGAGFGLEERPFRPHLTLARRGELRPGVSLEGLSAGLEELRFQVDGLSLMRSRLSGAGPRYTRLHRTEFP